MDTAGEHRFRLYVTTRTVGLFPVAAKDLSFTLPDGHTAWIVARNGANLAEATKLHFEAGAYESAVAARQAGEQLRLRLRILNAVLRLGINVPVTDTPSGQLADHIKREFAAKHDAVVIDCVFGLAIFPDDERHVELIMNGNIEVSPSDPQYWLQGLSQLWDAEITLDERSEDALGLLAMAGLESSPRNSFLVSYLALERLMQTGKRHATSQTILNQMEAVVRQAEARSEDPIPHAEAESLIGSIARLRFESLGTTLTKFAEQNPNYTVEGVQLGTFLRRCTKARNATAHPSGEREIIDYECLTRGLVNVVSCILWAKCKIPNLSIHRPADSISIRPGHLEFRAIHYQRR